MNNCTITWSSKGLKTHIISLDDNIKRPCFTPDLHTACYLYVTKAFRKLHEVTNSGP